MAQKSLFLNGTFTISKLFLNSNFCSSLPVPLKFYFRCSWMFDSRRWKLDLLAKTIPISKIIKFG